ncbi:hypothetical protein SVAN01_08806 [Stagonosporopsis vannaccii]|nr:hypothetical protein SVAN01_08806 [Stagonosporopsis vannaccii]
MSPRLTRALADSTPLSHHCCSGRPRLQALAVTANGVRLQDAQEPASKWAVGASQETEKGPEADRERRCGAQESREHTSKAASALAVPSWQRLGDPAGGAGRALQVRLCFVRGRPAAKEANRRRAQRLGGMRAGVGRVRFGSQRALPKRAPSEPSAPAPLHRACPPTPEPVDSQPPSQGGPALISRDSICWPPHSSLHCKTVQNSPPPAPSPCFCTSPLPLLLPPLAVKNWLPTHASATAFTTATDRLLALNRALPDWGFGSSLLRLATLPERPFHPNFPPGLARRLVQRPISHPSCLSLKRTVHQSQQAAAAGAFLLVLSPPVNHACLALDRLVVNHPDCNHWTSPSFLDHHSSAKSTSL